jgi:large subunit ribosomal protein L29
MPVLRAEEIRKMTPEERKKKLEELEEELIAERGMAYSGGAPENPGRLKELRKAIARIKTIQRELGEV